MSNWYKFKILYSPNQPEELAFNALVFDKNTYRILVDDQNLFKNTFLDIINGRLVLYKLNHDKLKKVTENSENLSSVELYQKIHDSEPINTNNAIDNLKKYIELNNSNGNNALMFIEKAAFHPYITMSYRGPDFNYYNGMNLLSANKAIKNITDIFRTANEVFDTGEQITIPKAGSLCYELHTTIDNIDAANFLKDIINQCNNNCLQFEQYNTNMREAAEKIVKSLFEASRIKNLENLEIDIRNSEQIMINLNNIKNLYNSICENYKEVKGVPDKFSNKNKTFSIGKFSFHIQEDDNIEENISLVKRAAERKKNVKVSGIIGFNRPNTIDVELIEEIII